MDPDEYRFIRHLGTYQLVDSDNQNAE
jgi:hypothetical protein